jgi:hypothetical protein
MEKVLEEVYENSDIQPLYKTVTLQSFCYFLLLSSNWSLPLTFPNQNFICIAHVRTTCYMFFSTYPHWFAHQILAGNFLLVPFSSASSRFLFTPPPFLTIHLITLLPETPSIHQSQAPTNSHNRITKCTR